MIAEFAIDPECLLGPDGPHILRGCAFEDGRVISEFPRGWVREVYDRAREANLDDRARNRLTFCIQQLRARSALVRRFAVDFDASKSWLDNACDEHEREQFEAVITAGVGGASRLGDRVVHVDGGDDGVFSSPRWNVPRDRVLDGSPRSIVDAVAPLVRFSKTIKFIDPHISATKGAALRVIWEIARRARQKIAVEIHSRYDGRNNEDPKTLVRSLIGAFGDKPFGATLSFVARPKPVAVDKKFHNRYVLSELGGIMFGDSFPGNVNDVCQLLSSATHEKFWEEYKLNGEGVYCQTI